MEKSWLNLAVVEFLQSDEEKTDNKVRSSPHMASNDALHLSHFTLACESLASSLSHQTL